VFWTASGIGLWLPSEVLGSLWSISRLDMRPDEWLPVKEVASEQPAIITQPS